MSIDWFFGFETKATLFTEPGIKFYRSWKCALYREKWMSSLLGGIDDFPRALRVLCDPLVTFGGRCQDKIRYRKSTECYYKRSTFTSEIGLGKSSSKQFRITSNVTEGSTKGGQFWLFRLAWTTLFWSQTRESCDVAFQESDWKRERKIWEATKWKGCLVRFFQRCHYCSFDSGDQKFLCHDHRGEHAEPKRCCFQRAGQRGGQLLADCGHGSSGSNWSQNHQRTFAEIGILQRWRSSLLVTTSVVILQTRNWKKSDLFWSGFSQWHKSCHLSKVLFPTSPSLKLEVQFVILFTGSPFHISKVLPFRLLHNDVTWSNLWKRNNSAALWKLLYIAFSDTNL